MYQVHITPPAELDIQSTFEWWRDRRSSEQAARWLDSIYSTIETLGKMPERCPCVPEANLSKGVYRQLLFGIGRRLTHRIVFTVEENAVFVLRVRHVAQANLESDEV